MMKELDRGYQTTDAPRPHSPIDFTHSTLEDASRLADRVANLADRLLGPAPTDVAGSEGAGPKPPNGVFGELDSHAERVRNAIAEAGYALSRIEGALP